MGVLREIIQKAVSKAGGTNVALAASLKASGLSIDESVLTRFSSGEKGLTIDVLEAILEISEAKIVPRDEVEDMQAAIRSLFRLWQGGGNGEGK